MAGTRSPHVKLPPFQLLLDRHSGELFRFLSASVGPVDAEDAFQDTFLSALRAYPKLRDASNLRAWLFQIAHRKALDVHRARGRNPIPVEQVPEVAVARGWRSGAGAVAGGAPFAGQATNGGVPALRGRSGLRPDRGGIELQRAGGAPERARRAGDDPEGVGRWMID